MTKTRNFLGLISTNNDQPAQGPSPAFHNPNISVKRHFARGVPTTSIQIFPSRGGSELYIIVYCRSFIKFHPQSQQDVAGAAYCSLTAPHRGFVPHAYLCFYLCLCLRVPLPPLYLSRAYIFPRLAITPVIACRLAVGSEIFMGAFLAP